jgi:hypothetical protein
MTLRSPLIEVDYTMTFGWAVVELNQPYKVLVRIWETTHTSSVTYPAE